jgi:hypothetical protein
MPSKPEPGPVEKRTISYRLPVDLIERVADDAKDEGRERTSGRMFNPSAVVERILREYYDGKPKRTRRGK